MFGVGITCRVKVLELERKFCHVLSILRAESSVSHKTKWNMVVLKIRFLEFEDLLGVISVCVVFSCSV